MWQEHGVFGAAELFRVTRSWCVHVLIHLSKPRVYHTEWTPYKRLTLGNNTVSILACQ